MNYVQLVCILGFLAAPLGLYLFFEQDQNKKIRALFLWSLGWVWLSASMVMPSVYVPCKVISARDGVVTFIEPGGKMRMTKTKYTLPHEQITVQIGKLGPYLGLYRVDEEIVVQKVK